MDFKKILENVQTSAKKVWNENQKAVIAVGAVVGGYVAIKTAVLAYKVGKYVAIQADFANLEEDIVHLYVFPRWTHGPNFYSPCLKAETFLRLAKIPYQIHFTRDISLSPTGRFPFIVHNGSIVVESEFIIQYVSENFGVNLDERLTPEECAKGLVVRRLVETSCNYGFNRTMIVDNARLMQDMFSKEYRISNLAAQMVVSGMRAKTIAVLNAVGYGDLTKEQYETEYLRDFQCIETLIGSKPFLFGNFPTTYDCVVYAWLQVAGEMGPHGPALSYLTSSKTLRDYINRITRIAFPDIDDLNTAHETQKFVPVQ